MYESNIMQLNKNCILEIIKQIKKNCETCKNPNRLHISKYSDLVSFALACEWFRDVFWLWNPSFYGSLEIDQAYLTKSSEIIVNFNKQYERLKKSAQNEKNRFWNMLIAAIKSNNSLESIRIVYVSNAHYNEHQDNGIFNMLIRCLQNKPTLKSLHIVMEGKFLCTFKVKF